MEEARLGGICVYQFIRMSEWRGHGHPLYADQLLPRLSGADGHYESTDYSLE